MKDKSNAGGMNSVFVRWIQFGSATVELVFAPEERDVYSHERRLKDLAPLGAKPGSGTSRSQKQLRSCGAKIKQRSADYKHLAPTGR